MWNDCRSPRTLPAGTREGSGPATVAGSRWCRSPCSGFSGYVTGVPDLHHPGSSGPGVLDLHGRQEPCFDTSEQRPHTFVGGGHDRHGLTPGRVAEHYLCPPHLARFGHDFTVHRPHVLHLVCSHPCAPMSMSFLCAHLVV